MLIKDSLYLLRPLLFKDFYCFGKQELKSHRKIRALPKVDHRFIHQFRHTTRRGSINLGNFWPALLKLELIFNLAYFTCCLINFFIFIWPILCNPLILHNSSGNHWSFVESREFGISLFQIDYKTIQRLLLTSKVDDWIEFFNVSVVVYRDAVNV